MSAPVVVKIVVKEAVPFPRPSFRSIRAHTADKKARNDYTASQAIILACKPYDWIDDFPKTNVASSEVRAQIREKWKDLF